ncbi:hypothetical protein HKBW3S42_00491 [Candidatus Hakubella thermalkaliphila]|jgi:hypothetical protein|uniref:Uncharacterized protein n=1 Tax=Candidatus Hakubella thermalkaliphila TaxID=2754717 RepID=A0A6V8NH44_9ACTN|nr:hypothetical protein [Candidatus Hakubella thermalkaliphila]GFP18684.1 hypothetical protein HKBW3S03_00189 [Candidatus Hakubella thermalkaliphila]GFP23314.1 hypothetical protein HKBW3S09_00781 [Candidatus Hakubella thermalkaliphila]GFP29767.1 hypothetical protein HKBW3S34_00687 [Candidatus Hakubella thermalkaliphila]GFP32186.1 hypothetical protein HKBW3S42_00491 [Candidatus Hakubella thermalkaliphila]GFP39194.1 hypothetical protein HKBW3S47_00894 [Candidatus Hakubella thermalkaliphila]
MEDILLKLKSIEKLVKSGIEDKVVERTVDKLYRYQSKKLSQDLDDVESRIKAFEGKYQIGCDEFLARYRTGELGDHADYLEWYALCDMANRLRERMKVLTS